MTNGEKKKISALPIILLVLLILACTGAAGWFGYSFYARKQQDKRAKIAEEQRKAQVAKEVADLLKSAKTTYEENKREEALAIVEQALRKDPQNAEARKWSAEMSEAIDLEKLIPVKKQAEVKWASARTLAPGQGFAEQLKKTEAAFAESEKLFSSKDYRKAATNYQAVATESERLLGLDVERQQARGFREESDKAHDAAGQAKAEEEAKQLWADARGKDKEATAAFENGEFGKASDAWKASGKIYSDAAVFSSGTLAVRAAEKSFNDVLATARAGLLDAFGGQKWTDTRALADTGRKLAGDQKWADAVAAWGNAADALRDAVKFAEVEEARDKIRKEYNAAMTGAGASLAECQKARKTDSARISVLQGAISTLEKVRESASYGLLGGDEHHGLDRMLKNLHREKFYFRFPDLVQVDQPREVSTVALAPGSSEARAAQQKAVVDMDAFLEVKTRKTGIVLRLIPAGRYAMGRGPNENGDKDEMPRHNVVLTRHFYMATFEVTQDQWAKAGVKGKPSHFAGEGRGEAPVESVSFEKAAQFCAWLCDAEDVPRGTYRLPTEAEWEYACRAGTDSSFYTGLNRNDLARAGWFGENSGKMTRPVGQKAPNAFGLYDMLGNVWEWCSDGARDYASTEVNDPAGPTDGWTMVTRGGSWRDESHYCRSANRGWARKRDLESYDLGLRVVRVLPPEPRRE